MLGIEDFFKVPELPSEQFLHSCSDIDTTVKSRSVSCPSLAESPSTSESPPPPPPPVQQFYEGELWWCSLSTEQKNPALSPGTECRRPVLIFKKFGSKTFLGLQLTKQEKVGSWYVEIDSAGKRRWVIMSRPIVLEAVQLADKIGVVSAQTFSRVRENFLYVYSN